jgi:hypothetical protein
VVVLCAMGLITSQACDDSGSGDAAEGGSGDVSQDEGPLTLPSEVSAALCSGGAGEMVMEAASSADAANMPVLTDASLASVTLPASGVGYVGFDVVAQHSDVYVLTGSAALALETMVGDEASWAALASGCGAALERGAKLHVHDSGLMVMSLSGAPSQVISLAIARHDSDHSEADNDAHTHDETDSHEHDESDTHEHEGGDEDTQETEEKEEDAEDHTEHHHG